MHITNGKHSFLNANAVRNFGKAVEVISRKKFCLSFPSLMKVEPP